MSKVNPITQNYAYIKKTPSFKKNLYHQNIETAKKNKSFITKKRVILSIGLTAAIVGLYLYFRKEPDTDYMAKLRRTVVA